MADLKFKDVTDVIISAFYHVNNTLGYGFLEKVYENALCFELQQRGFTVTAQTPITVWYKGVAVGEYFADLIVNHCVIVELKSGVALSPAHEAQLINYLKATGIEVGLLLLFSPKPQVKRKVFTHSSNTKAILSDQRESA
jgi:GxxExxY protein